jgi:tetratricopeptide (TPR) repeat protein
VFDVPVEVIPDAVSPAKYVDAARRVAVPVESISYDQVHRFLQGVTPAEYDAAVSSRNPRDPVNIFRTVLAKTWTDHRVAMDAYREQQPLVMMMSYDGTDAVNHLFSPYHPPYRQDVSSEDYRKYWSGVSNYYSEVDRLIGEWMSILPADTTVIVMSAHGFRWGKTRPEKQPQGSALSDHRNPGIVIAYGNHVEKSGGTHTMSVYDLTPTILAIIGLPQSADMPGHVATWAFRDITPVQGVRVISYSEFLNLRPLAASTDIAPQAYEAALQAVGHLSDPSRNAAVLESDQQPQTQTPLRPDQWGRYAYYNNLGVELRRQNKIKDAVEAFQQAIELDPNRPTPYLNAAMALIDRQQYTAADEAFVTAVAKGLPDADRWFVDYAALYRERNMDSRAIAILYKGKSVFPQSYEIAANLGSALAAASRYTEGLPELERALGLQPASTLALNNIGAFYSKKEDYARALDFWNRSLAIDPRQPEIRAAAEAARTRL